MTWKLSRTQTHSFRRVFCELHRQFALTVLVTQQPLLPRDSTAVARERAVRADDAVAGDDQRDGVRPIRGADRAHRVRPADLLRDVRVRAGLSELDAEQRVPHRALELGTARLERQVEA